MPTGIYDRSKAKPRKKHGEGPQARLHAVPKKAKPAKKVAAKRAARRPAALKPAVENSGQYPWGHDALPLVTPAPDPVAPRLRDYFVVSVGNTLQVFDTTDEAVRALLDAGVTAERLGSDPSARVLKVQAAEDPMPQQVRLTYTL